MPDSNIDPDAEYDEGGEWPQPRLEDVYVSAAGKYCCENCRTVLEATREKTVARGHRRGVWECPECDNRYAI